MSFACEGLRAGSSGVTITTREVPGAGCVEGGPDEEEPLNMYRTNVKKASPPRMAGRRLRRLRRRYVDEGGVYAGAVELLRG